MKTISFFSFKGGVGRTALLVNLASYWATLGQVVAIVDMNLATPGVSHSPLLEPTPIDPNIPPCGLHELLATYYTKTPNNSKANRLPSPSRHFQRMRPPMVLGEQWPQTGAILVLPAGKPSCQLPIWSEGGTTYTPPTKSRPREKSWRLFSKLLQQDIEAYRLKMGEVQRPIDLLLIDCRTGWPELLDLSLGHLADHMVLVSGISQQSQEGLRHTLNALRKGEQGPIIPFGQYGDNLTVAFSPIPAHIHDDPESQKALKKCVDILSAFQLPPTDDKQHPENLPPVYTLPYTTQLLHSDQPLYPSVGRKHPYILALLEIANRLLPKEALQKDVPDVEHKAEVMCWSHLGYQMQEHSEHPEEAEIAYRRAIELDAKNARLWNNLGSLLWDPLNRPEEAEMAYRHAIALDGKDAIPWNNLGWLLHEEFNRYEEAEAAYRRAIQLDEQFSLPWNNLGWLLHEQFHRYEEAEAAYRRAIQLDETDVLPWNNLGWLLHEQFHRYEEAEAAYRRAIKLDENYTLPWINLGMLLSEHLNRPEEAVVACRRAIELDKNNPLLWSHLGGILHEKLNRYEEAEAAYRHAIELDGKNARLWNRLGWLLHTSLNRHKEAEDAYRHAIKLDEKDGLPWNNLGWLLHTSLNRPEEAEDAYRRAIELDGKDVRPWVNLGVLYAQLNRPEEAEAALRRATELEAQNTHHNKNTTNQANSPTIPLQNI